MVKNPTRTQSGYPIIHGGEPASVEVIFRRDPRIWYAEVRNKTGEMMDFEYPGGMAATYVEDAGNKTSAMRNARDIAAWHDIPLVVVSGGKPVKTLKPPW